jgi:cytochrome o ubiquinol oxidase subunit II
MFVFPRDAARSAHRFPGTAGRPGDRACQRKDGAMDARRLMRRLTPLGLTPLLAGCAEVMDPAGPVGAQEKTILLNSLAIMLCIIVPVIVATVAFAWWFRAGNVKAVYRPDFAYSGRVEMVVWAIPLLTIMFLGGICWISSHDLDPARPLESPANAAVPAPKPVDVQVVSLDWKWLFIYPQQGIASVNHLVIPAGTPINFHITSASVMNSFFVPRLGSMIYSMNGMSVQLNLQADKPGRYDGHATHFSGDGFSDMDFTVDALPAAQFASWVAGAKAAGPVLTQANYMKFQQPSEKVAPFTFRAVQPNLYDAVVRQDIPPAHGPTSGTPGPQVRPETDPEKGDFGISNPSPHVPAQEK